MKRALVMLPLLLLPACGGGGDDGEDVKATYVADATEVCEGAVEDFEALETPTTPEGFAPYADSLVGILEEAHSELVSLTAPEADEARLDEKVVDPLEELVAEGRAYAAQVRAAGTDQAKLLTLLSERPTGDTIDVDYLRSYGLSACAEAVEKAG